MAVISYYPEMGEKRPTKFDGRLSFGGSHNYIDTPHTLTGRGVKFLGVYNAEQLTEQGQYKVGWNYYRVTDVALEKIRAKLTLVHEALL